MEFYIDSGNTDLIQHYISNFHLQGITCNPAILIKDQSTIREVMKVVPKEMDLYFEVIATDHDGIVEETKKLVSLGENITVKIPATPEGFVAIRELTVDSWESAHWLPLYILFSRQYARRIMEQRKWLLISAVLIIWDLTA